jgi:hypothetical protein
MFPEVTPSPFGPDGVPASMVEEGRRAHALEMAVRLYSAREHGQYSASLSIPARDRDVLETADRFAAWLRGGSDG